VRRGEGVEVGQPRVGEHDLVRAGGERRRWYDAEGYAEQAYTLRERAGGDRRGEGFDRRGLEIGCRVGDRGDSEPGEADADDPHVRTSAQYAACQVSGRGRKSGEWNVAMVT